MLRTSKRLSALVIVLSVISFCVTFLLLTRFRGCNDEESQTSKAAFGFDVKDSIAHAIENETIVPLSTNNNSITHVIENETIPLSTKTKNNSIAHAIENETIVPLLTNNDEVVGSVSPSKMTPIPSMNVPGEKVFPQRLISVFGVEDSGTKFLTKTLAVATGLQRKEKPFVERINDRQHNLEILHISLPWGGVCQKKEAPNKFAVVPDGCAANDFSHWGRKKVRAKLPKSCQQAGLNQFVTYPGRFFVNITSHILWYETRGVETATVIIMRDSSINLLARIESNHCNNETWALREGRRGSKIINEVFAELNQPNSGNLAGYKVLLVSYETLMSLKEEYLFYIYRQLGINSAYVPKFLDSNPKYLRQKKHNNAGKK